MNPHVDNNENEFRVSLDVPGMKLEDLEITEDKGQLQVTGVQRKTSSDGQTSKKFRFCKTIPERVELDRLQAKLSNGVLELVAPKAPKPEPRCIQVESKPSQLSEDNSDHDKFQLTMDLPGVKAQDVVVKELDNGVLHVSGVRKNTLYGREQRFSKWYSVPERVELHKAQACLVDGVLELVAPKTPKPQPRKITVSNNKDDEEVNNSNSNEEATVDKFEVSMDVPGVTANDLNVSVHEGILIVSGSRKMTKHLVGDEESARNLKFSKRFILPDQIKIDELRANLADGVLVVSGPKTALPKPRKIVVNQVAESAKESNKV